MHQQIDRSPSWRASTLIAVALSLSIGWGVRGNFGHEYGAMLPGVMAAMAACILSGREDWLARAPYFAFFGALGWAFGGSMSYMKVVSYTESGHWPSQMYGFFGLFAGGFLWAAMGGAGTSYAAVEDRDRITQLFKPLCWVLAAWALFIYFGWVAIMGSFGLEVQELVERGIERELRQNDPFYWLDTDWVQAFVALVALCAFDLWDRRFAKAWLLATLAGAGAIAGWLVQLALAKTAILAMVLPSIVRFQGDLSITNPETNQPFDPANMVTNWPTVFGEGAYAGVVIGLLIGAGIYFAKSGQWRSGASLLVHMAVGWLVVFLVFPVLLGVRMTPPRNDNWAGVAGVWLGMAVYMYRNGRTPVIVGSLVTGIIGGFGIAFTQLIKLMLMAPGNANRLSDLPPEAAAPIVKSWEHWQQANWHSIAIEQGAGIIYGIGVAVAVAMLATRVAPVQNEPRTRRWTEVFSVAFVLCGITYLSMIKLVAEYTKERAGGFVEVPMRMKAPLFEGLEFSSRTWFNFFFALYALCVIALLVVHLRRRIPLVPESWLGKAQLLYIVFVWIVVAFNQTKAQAAFHEQRLGTEGVIFLNAVIVTFLIAVLPRTKLTGWGEAPSEPRGWDDSPQQTSEPHATQTFPRLLRRTLLAGLATATVCTFGFAGVTRAVYGDKSLHAGHKGFRFGPQTEWRLYPVLRDKDHR
ncbi:MAG: hypothetical protein HUU46_23915 [Candidatus Hydrogenedentes bacterium]|nr:hypothetical protein [Candidatus Hydrogenedentota bacterium]